MFFRDFILVPSKTPSTHLSPSKQSVSQSKHPQSSTFWSSPLYPSNSTAIIPTLRRMTSIGTLRIFLESSMANSREITKIISIDSYDSIFRLYQMLTITFLVLFIDFLFFPIASKAHWSFHFWGSSFIFQFLFSHTTILTILTLILLYLYISIASFPLFLLLCEYS